MAINRDEKHADLIARARARIDFINNSSVFRADFQCARLLEEMITEIELLSHENKSLKKIL